ncbi:MAG: hypothetical protein OXH00_21645 [Candidatus Poribacteria bacterium]|nr:hypothetical protein [Candidatus Poribacteria bacterium]
MPDYTIKDDRTDADKAVTIGFVVATDTALSRWGGAKGGRSIVARPVRDREEYDRVVALFEDRDDFKRVRYASGSAYKPRLHSGDHLHIYGFDTFNYQ